MVILHRLLSYSFVRFAAVGGIGTLIDFILFYGLHVMLGWGLVVSNILSYSVGLTSSFFLNRCWTFKSTVTTRRIWLSLLFGYVGLAINTALVLGLSDTMPVMFAKVIAVILVLAYNYLANKYLVFGVS